MNGEMVNSLRRELRDREYAESYAESFMNSFVATQIKVIREQRGMTQSDLAREVGTTQTGISRIENVNYSSWSVKTLIKLARAFHVRLRVSFESFGTLPDEVVRFERRSLERAKRDEDPGLAEPPSPMSAVLNNRDANVFVIDMFKPLAATAKSQGDRKKKPIENEVADDVLNDSRPYIQTALGGTQWS